MDPERPFLSPFSAGRPQIPVSGLVLRPDRVSDPKSSFLTSLCVPGARD